MKEKKRRKKSWLRNKVGGERKRKKRGEKNKSKNTEELMIKT